MGPGWDEESIARLREDWLIPPDDEPRPRNPFLPPLSEEDSEEIRFQIERRKAS